MKRGFSIIEILVVLAMVSIGGYALMSLVSNQQKSMKNIEQKNTVQSFVQTVNLSIANTEECRVALDLVKTPFTVEKVRLPGQTGSVATEFERAFDKFVLPGVRTLTPDAEFEGLIFKSAKLKLLGPMTEGGLRYLGNLEVLLEKRDIAGSLGAQQFTRRVPLQVAFTAVDPQNVQLTECYGAGGLEPELLCSQLGGRWLSSTNNEAYPSMKSSCPMTSLDKERCVMDSAFTLARDELADNVPCDGGANSAGERVEECYYQSTGSVTVKTALCPSYEGVRNGNRCHFDPATKRWGMWYFKGGLPTKKRYQCDRGVKISTKASSTEQLAWNERLYMIRYAMAPEDNESGIEFSASEQISLQETVEKCFYEPDSEKFQLCNNASIAASGYLATGGSCVYVKGIQLLNSDSVTTKRINRCLAEAADPSECPSGVANYTGWIRVSSDYPRKVSEKLIGGNILTEARGYPCFRVEMNSSLGKFPEGTETSVLEKVETVPATEIKDSPGRVKQCLFKATASPSRKTLLPCGNEAAGMTGDDYDYVGYNASGSSNDVEAKIKKDTCWYVRSTPVKNVGTYTGWIRFRADLPDWGHYNLLADHSLQRKAGSTNVIQGDPCEVVYVGNPE